MLGGTEPVIIFQFSKLANSPAGLISEIPLISKIPTVIDQPPIPIYLSERLTGIIIEAEDKSVDIETELNTLSDGEEPDIKQKGIASNITVNLVANKAGIGITVLSSLIDLVFDKVTSKEYAITYLNGALTIFRARLQSFQVNQNSDTTKLSIQMILTRGEKDATKPTQTIQINKVTGTLPL